MGTYPRLLQQHPHSSGQSGQRLGQWQKWKQQNLHHQVSFWAEVGMHSTTQTHTHPTQTHAHTNSCLLVWVCLCLCVRLSISISVSRNEYLCLLLFPSCFVSFAHWQNYKLRILRAPTTQLHPPTLVPVNPFPNPYHSPSPNPSRHCLRCQRIEVQCRPNQVCNFELLSYYGSLTAFGATFACDILTNGSKWALCSMW